MTSYKLKQKEITEFYHVKETDELFKKWYVDDLMSPKQISDRILEDTGHKVSHKTIQYRLRKLYVIRTPKEACKVALVNSRRSMDALKPYFTGYTTASGDSIRISVSKKALMRKNNFTCFVCGSKSFIEEDFKIHLNDKEELLLTCKNCVPPIEKGIEGDKGLAKEV